MLSVIARSDLRRSNQHFGTTQFSNKGGLLPRTETVLLQPKSYGQAQWHNSSFLRGERSMNLGQLEYSASRSCRERSMVTGRTLRRLGEIFLFTTAQQTYRLSTSAVYILLRRSFLAFHPFRFFHDPHSPPPIVSFRFLRVTNAPDPAMFCTVQTGQVCFFSINSFK